MYIAAPAKPANGVDEAMRAKGRTRVLAALRTNPTFGRRSDDEVQRHAASVEEGCFTTSQQRYEVDACWYVQFTVICRQTYISKIANAARLAKTEADVGELIRIASGQPRSTPA